MEKFEAEFTSKICKYFFVENMNFIKLNFKYFI